MKKTFILAALFLGAMVSQGVTTLFIENQNDTKGHDEGNGAEKDLLAVNSTNYFWNLRANNDMVYAGDNAELVTTLSTKPTTPMAYEIQTWAASAVINLSEAIYLNGFNANASAGLKNTATQSALTLNLGEELGSINTWYQAALYAKTLTLNLKASEASLQTFSESGTYEYTFFSSFGGAGNDSTVTAEITSLTLNIEGIDLTGYTNAGVVTSLDGLGANTYGILKTADTLSVFVTPEPATATLSLLALAGLCARRKRH